MKESPTPEEMNKVIANMKKTTNSIQNHNSYWMNCITSYYISGVNPERSENFDHIVDKLQPKRHSEICSSLFQGCRCCRSDFQTETIIFGPKHFK